MDLIGWAEVGTNWDEFACITREAWFWHTHAYRQFLLEVNRHRDVTDHSFAIVEDSRLVAICPLIVDSEGTNKRFGCGEEPVPAPAISQDLPPDRRHLVLSRYMSVLSQIARETNVSYALSKVPALAGDAGRSGAIHPLVPFGFFDVSELTQVIGLKGSVDGLWKAIRKGHRADIRRAKKSCEIVVWDASTVNAEVVDRYRATHRADAGRETRSALSFAMMLDWVKTGHAVLFEAVVSGAVAGFVLVVTYRDGAYYGSGCRSPEYLQVPVGHLLQWHVIRWLAARGYAAYDIGVQAITPQWFDVPSKKAMDISLFKRGFGGELWRVPRAEYFYDKALFANTMARRTNAYLAAMEIDGA